MGSKEHYDAMLGRGIKRAKLLLTQQIALALCRQEDETLEECARLVESFGVGPGDDAPGVVRAIATALRARKGGA